MRASVKVPRRAAHRSSPVFALGLLAAALLVGGLGSCAPQPTRSACLLPNGQVAEGVTETWCVAQGGSIMDSQRLERMAFGSSPVYSIPDSALTPIACGDTTEMTLELNRGQWIGLKLGWIAVDSATAKANWDSMSYRFTIDDSLVTMPTSMEWVSEPVSFTCPDRTLAGILRGPVVYLPPLTRERKLGVAFSFRADVNDGWSTFSRGTTSTMTVVLRPRP